MKKFIQFTAVLFLFVHSIGYGQENNTEAITKTSDTAIEKQDAKIIIETEKFKSFIGKFLLVEGDFELEIVREDESMYIISPFSKDILIQKNETTLREPTRGVDLERIADEENALKFTQNGYETIIKRVVPKTEK